MAHLNIAFSTVVLAQGIKPPLTWMEGGDGVEMTSRIISSLVTALLVGGVLTCLSIIAYGSYQWISAGNDKTALQAAQGKVFHAVMGLFILLSLFVILRVMGKLFGFNLFELVVPSVTTTS